MSQSHADLMRHVAETDSGIVVFGQGAASSMVAQYTLKKGRARERRLSISGHVVSVGQMT